MLVVLLYVLVLIALVLLLLFIIAARRPDEFSVKRGGRAGDDMYVGAECFRA